MGFELEILCLDVAYEVKEHVGVHGHGRAEVGRLARPGPQVVA